MKINPALPLSPSLNKPGQLVAYRNQSFSFSIAFKFLLPEARKTLYALYCLALLSHPVFCFADDLGLTLRASSASVVVNGKLVYSIKVDNLGAGAADNIVVKNRLPARAEFQSASPECSFINQQEQNLNLLTCKRAQLSPQQSASWSITIKAPAEPTPLENRASVRSAGTDTRLQNNSARVTTNMIPGHLVVQPLKDIVLVSQTAGSIPQTYIEMAVNSVLAASQLRDGRLTTTGTLRQSSANGFSYAAQPADALQVILAGGKQFKLSIVALDGDLSGGVERFLKNPYIIDFKVLGNLAADLVSFSITSKPDPQDQHVQLQTIKGSSLIQKVPWNMNLSVRSQVFSQVDGSLAELDSKQAVQGVLKAPTLGLSVNEKRFVRYHLVNTTENIHEEFDRSITTQNGAAYTLQGLIFMAFKNARPIDTDQWTIQGSLMEGGATLSDISLLDEITGLAVVLNLDGEPVPLLNYRF